MAGAHIQRDLSGERLTRAQVQKFAVPSLVVGILGLAVAGMMGGTSADHGTRLMHAYLVAYCFFLAIALGGLFFVTLQHLTRAGWSVVVRRLAEALSQALPVMGILLVPLLVVTLMGNHHLWEWTDIALVAKDHILTHKESYLNTTFFVVRMVVVFGIWTLFARFFFIQSLKQDATGDWALTAKCEHWSPIAMILFALTLTVAAFDLMMSLSPHWFSTIYGVYYFAGCVLSGMATLILMAKFLQSRGFLKGVVTTEHYHDLGKLLFAFNFFWGYIAFSQFMLLWYANIPEETQFYLVRQEGGWMWFSLLLLFGHFVIPFVGLMSRHAKRRANLVIFWAVWLLVAHWIDIAYLILPTMAGHGVVPAGVVTVGLTELATMVGIGGIFLASVAWALRERSLVPLRDPRLGEALRFENV